ncbi:Clan MC, family M14, Zinc carboxypeptidase-like metallopeptidase [Trichomonas vaginalis G3]|uniref:Clan MC, family M14, Zinc carboxypeptidase-like metallopeptidase n=1 Tax=Trichomonas vaginalis (strain ATCC PRA-98 / G3) TaxID=412133 RepID=A2DHB9_TRIV3|nr:cytosolic carboxypeptidase family [Trichomonas vaginalis G3]EAY20192.1 Clan MC, family M14, Zinc carboxypeptidase-like metallopeptidase [Trichomonas vaginalis G3]KAI5507671.1 cytosolic carboxypeptidase family [Trichomonas vaginalis G3]|eukprot:XP_001581178.1 Clan MC, family M14, Zinc carboxypeptidase-like metallopeptidase [Trichomonas vaginalis G3]
MSSDSDNIVFEDDIEIINEEEQEIEEFEISDTTLKDNLYIIHSGEPSKEKSTFAKNLEEVSMKSGIYKSGELVYNILSPNPILEPPTDKSDTILRFDSKFESGNLSEAYHVSENTYNLILEYDHNKEGSCQWFYFRITNARKNTEYTFYITGFHKKRSIFSSGTKIFWYSEHRAKEQNISWTRGGENYCYGNLPGQKRRFKKRYTVSFTISFPYDDDVIYLAYALPYTYSDLCRDIQNWKERCSFVKEDILSQTLGGRDCPILTVTEPNEFISDDNKNCIFVTARIHPGESNGSFLMRGFFKALIDDNKIAKFLRQNYIFKIIPMMNIDGVIEGYYRVSLSGDDLNRIWSQPDETLHPVVTKAKSEIKSILKQRKIVMFVDFHGHSRLHGTFAFGCPNDGTVIQDTEKTYPRLLSYLCDAFSWQNCEFSFPNDRKSAARIVIRTELEVVQSFTVETSFGGIIAGPRAGILYDQDIWEELGATCFLALDPFFKCDLDDDFLMAKHYINSIRLSDHFTENLKPADEKSEDETIIFSDNKPPELVYAPEELYWSNTYSNYFQASAFDIQTEKPEKINIKFQNFPSFVDE